MIKISNQLVSTVFEIKYVIHLKFSVCHVRTTYIGILNNFANFALFAKYNQITITANIVYKTNTKVLQKGIRYEFHNIAKIIVGNGNRC